MLTDYLVPATIIIGVLALLVFIVPRLKGGG